MRLQRISPVSGLNVTVVSASVFDESLCACAESGWGWTVRRFTDRHGVEHAYGFSLAWGLVPSTMRAFSKR